MSGYLAGRVWNSDLDSTLKPTTACLADFANQDGDGIYPSNEYLCWLTGAGRATIKRHMAELRRIGVLVPVENEGGGRGKITRYRMDVDSLPKRASWQELRKGLISDPLSVKGLISDQQTAKRVSFENVKGLICDMRNKEEPLVDPLDKSILSSPSAQTSEFQLSNPEKNPSVKEKKASAADPRHRRFTEMIQKAHRHYVKDAKNEPVTPLLGTASGGNLKKLLKSFPKLDEAQFRRWLTNYHESKDHNPYNSPAHYILKLPNYEGGQVNKFGRLDDEQGIPMIGDN